MPIRKGFPSLNALVVLESAARHRSFTVAATELAVTQTAVSRQIAMLEEELGVSLFVRKHRAIEPTPACLVLANSLAASLAKITESVDLVRGTVQQRPVTIGATLGISSLWLLPRIGEFRKKFPAAQIRLLSQDSRISLDAGEVDVVVRFGTPPFDDGQTLASRSDEVFAVCAPSYQKMLVDAGYTFPHDADLLGQDVPDRSWFTWSDWFARAGVSTSNNTPSLSFSHYTEVLEAARAGHGVALGWGVLVDASLRDGSLMRLSEQSIPAENRYNVVVPWRPKPNAIRDVLVDWLAECLSRR